MCEFHCRFINQINLWIPEWSENSEAKIDWLIEITAIGIISYELGWLISANSTNLIQQIAAIELIYRQSIKLKQIEWILVWLNAEIGKQPWDSLELLL